MAGILAVFSLLAGCRLLGLVTVVAVGTVGLAGYAVYKTGETAVTGVGNVAKAVGSGFSKTEPASGSTVSSESKSVATIVYKNGEYKTECPAKIDRVWAAANTVFGQAEFTTIAASRDEHSAQLTVKTREAKDVHMQLKSLDASVTELAIRVGVKGDLQIAETIHHMIAAELTREVSL